MALSSGAVVDKIRLIVRQRRVRLIEFFLSFDSTGKKHCTPAQFRRALDMSGVTREMATVGEDELYALVGDYTSASDPGKVRYADFCDDVDEVFTIKGLQKTPLSPVKLALDDEPIYYSRIGLRHPRLDDAAIAALRQTLLALGRSVSASGVVIKDFFVDFDHNNDGCITRAEFMRNVHRLHRRMTNTTAEQLASAYAVPQGVHFRALQADVEALGVGHVSTFNIGTPKAGEVGRAKSISGRLNANAEDYRVWAEDRDAELAGLERKLALQVSERRIRLAEFFLDFDPLRHGTCPEPKFVQGLRRTFTTKLSPAAVGALAEKYRAAPDVVSWRSFVDAIEGIMADLCGPEKEASSVRWCAKPSAGLEAILFEIRDKIKKRRVLLVPTFQDFDPRRNEHVTRDQFERVLAQFGLLPDTRAKLKALLAAYAAQDGRHPADHYVNYRSFLGDVTDKPLGPADEAAPGPLADAPGSTGFPRAMSASLPSLATSTTGEMDVPPLRPAPVLLQHVRQKVLQNRVRLKEFFRDDDPLHRGVVTRSQFYRGLRAAVDGIVSAEEAEVLSDAYTAVGGALDTHGMPFVKWVEFVTDVDRVFVPEGLEKRPMADVAAETAAARAGEDLNDATVMSLTAGATDDVLDAAQPAIARLSHIVKVQGLEMQPFFEDFDKANSGRVRETHFRRVLSMVGLLGEMSADELAALVASCVDKPPFSLAAVASHSRDTLSSADINYDKFLSLIGSVGSHGFSGTHSDKQKEFPTGKRLKKSVALPVVDVVAVIDDLVSQLAARRARLQDFLTDGDKLRSGEISIARFKSALGRAGLTLTEATLVALTKRFQSSKHSDCINWRAFVTALENSHYAGPVEHTPASIESANHCESDPQLLTLLGKLRTIIAERRLHLKPSFQDYDKHNRLCCSKEQLAAVMDKMQLKTTATDNDLLFKAFKVPEGLHPVGKDFFDYKAFVGSIDPMERF